MLDLGQIRNEIDGIDKQLVELFEQRMKLTKEVAEYKIQTGKKVLDREREKAKIESVTKLVKNKENVHAIDDLFSQIMANSRKGQYQLLEAMGQTLRQPYEAIDEIKKDNTDINIYRNNNDNVKIDIIVKNGNIYLRSNESKKIEVIDDNSSIELIDDHYKSIAKEDIDKYNFDFKNVINSNFKK